MPHGGGRRSRPVTPPGRRHSHQRWGKDAHGLTTRRDRLFDVEPFDELWQGLAG